MKIVKIIFDRRKTASKTGTGNIDICVYLSHTQRKFETVGSATPDSWEAAAQDKAILAKVKHYEQVINAMQLLGEEMTIANFTNHVCCCQSKAAESEEGKHMFNGQHPPCPHIRGRDRGRVRRPCRQSMPGHISAQCPPLPCRRCTSRTG